ncbi:M13 family metallopeptidase [Massilia varians]|uniref:M13 family metallopeptidase n=1 Tax=Massilia varians TaxID=457921 RepID=UPI002554D28F|nr:M13-type metalloendopeptidase [Massilia varians]MDK6080202.1 M13-type metalloendopeptidase [Massilia varians]
MKRHILSAAALVLVASMAQAESGNSAAKSAGGAKAKTLSAGIALEYVEPAVRAQDDFFQHLNGKWLKSVEIPADKSSWGAFHKLHDDTQPQLRAIIERSAAVKNARAGSEEQLIGDFFASYMDEARLEQLGIAPLKGELASIAALKDKAELPAVFARLGRIGVTVPFGFYIHQDAKDSTKYVADLYQGGLGMPDRDYYLKLDDAKLADTRAKYQQHVEKMLALSGDAKAAANAKAIVDLETELARVQWTKVENRDSNKTYNKVEIAKLAELAPGYDWNAWLKEAGIQGKMDYVIVSQPSYLKGMAEIVNRVPLETWQAYLQLHTVNSYASYLSKAFVDQRFAFHGTVLSGAPKLEPRWKRGVTVVEGALGDAVGKLYVKQHFPAERKARMEALVKNLLEAYRQSIDTLDWMSPATKKEAQAKLAKFTPKIGYPNKWKEYASLTVKRDDLVGNVMRSREVEYARELNKLGKPVDRDEWLMTPQTINAYYNPELNEIVFPAAILQPPFFDMAADDAVNYGAIGAVIGHEISHGFDDQGSQYDGDGNLRNWWTEEDGKRFAEKTKVLVQQYAAYSPLPGYQVNGELTLGENIGDNSGLAIAHKAYKLSLKGKKAPVIKGLSGDQRFYMGWGQVWRAKKREPALINQVKTDPHSPEQFRANGTLKNQPGFYEAFGVKEGDKMYLAPKDRVIIW